MRTAFSTSSSYAAGGQQQHSTQDGTRWQTQDGERFPAYGTNTRITQHQDMSRGASQALPATQQGMQQQWTAAPAPPVTSNFNFGFGPVSAAQQTNLTPPYSSHAASGAPPIGPAGAYSNTWQGQQQSTMHQHPNDEQADSLKAVKDLPAAFQPVFSFRCANCVFLKWTSCKTETVLPAPPGRLHQ